MIAMVQQAGSGECCNGCGKDFGDAHVCYWFGSRVCTDCHSELEAGYQKEEASKQAAAASEWRDVYLSEETGERLPALGTFLVAASLAVGLYGSGVLVTWLVRMWWNSTS